MSKIRKFVLAAALAAVSFAAFAQAPAPVPALPDAERRTTYSITASNCACAVGFQLYGDSSDYGNWIEVWVNGAQVPVSQWTVTSPTGPLANIARPITDAVLTFNAVQTGTVQIVGAVRPRRISQFAESRGVAARDLNQAISYIVAGLREVWDKINDVTGRTVIAPPGETLSVLPPVASRANMNAGFDTSGNLVPTVPVTSGSFSAGSGIVFTGTNPTTISTASVANPVVQPQGRLTLVSGVAVMASSQANATRVYYTPSIGNSVPLYDGTNLNPVAFPEVYQDTTDTSKSPSAVAANSCYDDFAWLDGITPRVTRGPAWTNTSTRSAGTALSPINGLFLNSVSITNGPAASRGTYVGTICSNASSTIDYTFGSVASGAVAGSFMIWNAYNQAVVDTFVGDSVASWTYNVSGVWRAANANNNLRVSFVRGLSYDGIQAEYIAIGLPGASTNGASGVGLNSTTQFCGSPGVIFANTVGSQTAFAKCSVIPPIGLNYLQAIEYNNSTTASTWLGASGVAYLQTGLHASLRQ